MLFTWTEGTAPTVVQLTCRTDRFLAAPSTSRCLHRCVRVRVVHVHGARGLAGVSDGRRRRGRQSLMCRWPCHQHNLSRIAESPTTDKQFPPPSHLPHLHLPILSLTGCRVRFISTGYVLAFDGALSIGHVINV